MGKKKRHRGHYCRICGGCKSNEQFSGKGHRNHICKKCQKIPKAKRQEILDRYFVGSVMDQKNISKGNIETLERISLRYEGVLAEQGAAIVKLAKLYSHRKKRNGWLNRNQRDLLDELIRLGLIHNWYEEPEEEYDSEMPEFWFNWDDDELLVQRCLEFDTELRFHSELIDAYEADVLGAPVE